MSERRERLGRLREIAVTFERRELFEYSCTFRVVHRPAVVGVDEAQSRRFRCPGRCPGTPGQVNLSSVIVRLFSMPNHANVFACARRSFRNKFRRSGASRARTKALTAFS